jgi:hypothetical protein
MIGLKVTHPRRGLENVPTSGSSQPFREQGELFPRWLVDCMEAFHEKACTKDQPPVAPPAADKDAKDE